MRRRSAPTVSRLTYPGTVTLTSGYCWWLWYRWNKRYFWRQCMHGWWYGQHNSDDVLSPRVGQGYGGGGSGYGANSANATGAAVGSTFSI